MNEIGFQNLTPLEKVGLVTVGVVVVAAVATVAAPKAACAAFGGMFAGLAANLLGLPIGG